MERLIFLDHHAERNILTSRCQRHRGERGEWCLDRS